MKRTGSMGSCVGPAVTSTWRPDSGFGAGRWRGWPGGVENFRHLRPCAPRHARCRPSRLRSGPTKCTPSALSWARLRCVAGCSHMRQFMAGATRMGLSAASSTAVARSSARPWAMRARIWAVAGATMMRSASRDRRMWPISVSSFRSNSSVNLLLAQRGYARAASRTGGGVGHDGADAGAAFSPADEIQRFVSRDAAANDQKDVLAVECHGDAGMFARGSRGRGGSLAHFGLIWDCVRAGGETKAVERA